MRTARLVWLLFLGGMGTALAEPLVVGFERFHASAPTVEGGRLLFNELGCVNCHDRKTGLPERRGPEIRNITQRVNASWLREFLAAPGSSRQGTTMPTLFAGHEDNDEIESVIHYLSSLKPKTARPSGPLRHTDAGRGRRLFHETGCAACHQPDPALTSNESFTYSSPAFSDIRRKYSLTSLTDFLRKPLETRPHGRMPDFHLDAQDASDIAGYLMNHPGSDPGTAKPVEPFIVDHEQARRGERIVAGKNCASCHDLPENVQSTPIPMHTDTGGCLDEESIGNHPRYTLNRAQVQSLRRFVATPTEAPAPGPMARLEMTLQSLNCFACHERDGIGGPDAARRHFFTGNDDLGDSGKLPPPLTGIGRKLKPDWLSGVLAGTHKVRPYLNTVMPVYGSWGDQLTVLFSMVDQDESPTLSNGDAEAGRKLLGTEGGNGCISCHRWGDHESLGIPGIDISTMSERLNPSWLQDYLIDPAAYRPNTLMPSFWPGGQAVNTNILDGDTSRQIAGIIAFARQNKGTPPGFPGKESDEYELIPTDRPIVLRTFMKGVGTHAIVVGFPQGIHLAYDGLAARPAMAWRGRFFNAYNTWFSRFAPFEDPPGDSIINWPADHPVRRRHFMGYRINEEGVPTFLWREGDVAVEETFNISQQGLERTLRTSAEDAAVPRVDHPPALQVVELPTSSPSTRRFIYQWNP